jgi:hypothetical protein
MPVGNIQRALVSSMEVMMKVCTHSRNASMSSPPYASSSTDPISPKSQHIVQR